MKRILLSCFLFLSMQTSFAGTGLLFNVSASGASANLTVSLCLNGRGPLSCQSFPINALFLTISTTIPNHVYQQAGIKVPPGYEVEGCTPIANGYCLFSVSNTVPVTFTINPVATLNYWVATNGSDSASGDYSHPFLTIQHAKDVVRNNPLRGISTLNVNIRGGTYRFTTTLSFDQNDSGSATARVVYRAAPGEIPEISGGQKLTGWVFNPSLNAWQAQATVSTFTMPRQLYVNGVRATRARTVAYPNYYTPTATGYFYDYIIGTDPQIPPLWNNPTVIEAVTATQWKMMRCPIASITGGNNVVMQNPCWDNANTFPSPWNFHLLSWWENALEFLDEPGEWYIDPITHLVTYMPLPGEMMPTADVELPIIQTLVQVNGDSTTPVSYISFEGLTFHYATWLDIDGSTNSSPSSSNGYVCDQSGFHLLGTDHNAVDNIIGHDKNDTRTPGNVSLSYVKNIIFQNNTFEHLGAVGLDFGTGSQNNQIINNVFNDISSAGIQLGGIDPIDHHPTAASITSDNLISNNLVQYTGQEFYDAAGIYVGVTTRTTVEHNDINNVPWAGIAIGWGWGLIDPGGYPGLPNATPSMWGVYNTPSAATGNQILHNKITNFLEQLWDGGAVYSTGFQGTSLATGQLIAYNVAEDKRIKAGGNIFYTDGGSRFITLNQNVSLNNPVGYLDFGPCLKDSSFPECIFTDVVPYGADMGGCTPYGDLTFSTNYFSDITTFYNPCSSTNPGHPQNFNLILTNNVQVTSASQVPASILNSAGRQ